MGGDERERAGREPSRGGHRGQRRSARRTTGRTRCPARKLRCFFRDDTLSDRIGFNYSTWHGDDAAQNFAQELAQVARNYNGAQGHAVLIALDGENAWEYYPFNGYYFLRALYAACSRSIRCIELTTLSECVARGLEPLPLQKVVAGSWVHGTLATWMGDAAKNAAWDLLCEAKQVFDRVMREGTLDKAQRAAVERQLALCESSDWFWWFGDYNPAEAVSQFDRLYRRQLVNLYRLLGVTPPANLDQPISVGRGSPESGGVMRRATASLSIMRRALRRLPVFDRRRAGVLLHLSSLAGGARSRRSRVRRLARRTRASACGRCCPSVPPARTAHPTGCAPTQRATLHFSIATSCRTPAAVSIRAFLESSARLARGLRAVRSAERNASPASRGGRGPMSIAIASRPRSRASATSSPPTSSA